MKSNFLEKIRQSIVKDWLPILITSLLGICVFLCLYFFTSPSTFNDYKNCVTYIVGFGIGLALYNVFGDENTDE